MGEPPPITTSVSPPESSVDSTTVATTATMTTLTPVMLPENTYAIMVHKKYTNRVRDFLLTPPPEIATSNSSSLRERLLVAPKAKSKSKGQEELEDKEDQVLLLDQSTLVGVSRDRRGYVVLLLPRVQRPVPSLSPLARQNISWVARMSHRLRLTTAATAAAGTAADSKVGLIAATTLDQVCAAIWKTLQALGYGCGTNQDYLLRIDMYPREAAADISRHLQRAAHQSCCEDKSVCKCDALVPDDPFEGPIVLTKSKSLCTHRLTIVMSTSSSHFDNAYKSDAKAINADADASSSSSCDDYYWGVETRSSSTGDDIMLEMKLNQEANQEVRIAPCCNRTGAEPDVTTQHTNTVGQVTEYSQIPLSRAYYKLEQVWQEFCCAPIVNGSMEKKTAWKFFQQGAGLDLGASPGGWTQVLVHKFGLEKVVAVDPGILAARVEQLPGVIHVHSKMEVADLRVHGPYSAIVCDASMIWMDLLKELADKVVPSVEWCLPCLWVVTMKFPYKTLGSVQRHVDSLHDTVAEHLDKMAKAMYPDHATVAIRPTYRIEHLMANSDSERTLIAVFDEDHKRQKPNED